MKKLLLLIATILTITAKSQTSVYHAFPDSNAVWNYHYIYYCFTSHQADDSYSITIAGDTVINTKTYHKLYTPYVISNFTSTCTQFVPGYKGAIRQDTTNKTVFIIPPSNNAEQLLYDFKLHVGDTVKGFLESIANPTDTVISIDSVLVGNSYRKRWYINSYYHERIIEGIGSDYGLLEISPGATTDYPDFSLTCFSQNGTTLYPPATNCELITNVNDLSTEQFSATISPNPFNSNATISFTSQFEQGELKVYNLLGEEMKRQKIISQTTIINREGLCAGLYIYQMTNNKKNMTTGKLLID